MSGPSTELGTPLPDDEYEAYVQKYPFAAEPTYFTRPNRYYGPASTWRSWTENERNINSSLNVEEARNLSIHLYNAFALKLKGGVTPTTRRTRSRARSRSRTLDEEGDTAIDSAFVPPDSWTAWPLDARDVPREDEGQTEHGPFGIGKSVRSSDSLEEALTAVAIRYAKEQWNNRPPEPEQPKDEYVKRDWAVERDLTKQQLKESGLLDDRPESPSTEASHDSTEVEDEHENDAQSPSPDSQVPEGVQTFSSQAFVAQDESTATEDDESEAESKDDQPVFTADDDHSRQILKPSVRHVLSKLDDLLTGLHKARAAYANKDRESRSRSTSAMSRGEASEAGRFIRSGSRASVKKDMRRKRKRWPSEELSSQPEARSISRGRSKPRSVDGRQKRQRVGLRDWSDVLGMAALTGWNTETIARASERCALLFNQNMMFRTFHEPNPDAASEKDREGYFEEEYALVDANTEHQESVRDASHSETVSPAAYIRSSNPCDRCQTLSLNCVAPTSITDPQLDTYVACRPCATTQDLSTPCSGIRITCAPELPEISARSTAFQICPYPTCSQHILGKPFTKNYHLQLHLKRVHGHVYSPPPTSPSSMKPPRLTLPIIVKGGEDGLQCPVVDCSKRPHRFGRPARLYEHIRGQHPDVDVEDVKDRMRRRRKKLDRSQKRSESQRRKSGKKRGNPESPDDHGDSGTIEPGPSYQPEAGGGEDDGSSGSEFEP